MGGVVPNFASPEKVLDTIAEAISGPKTAASSRTATRSRTRPARRRRSASTRRPTPSRSSRGAYAGPPDPYDPGDVRHERLFFPELMTVLDGFDYVFCGATDAPPRTTTSTTRPEPLLLHRRTSAGDVPPTAASREVHRGGLRGTCSPTQVRRTLVPRALGTTIDPDYGVNPTNLYNRSMGWRRLSTRRTSVRSAMLRLTLTALAAVLRPRAVRCFNPFAPLVST